MKKLLSIVAVVFMSVSYAQLNMTELGSLSYTENLSDVWGWVDGTGTEYALVGVYDGFSVVSLNDPTNPVEVFFESGVSSTWRDIKTWNNHAYVTTEGGDGLLIVDLSTLPANPNLSVTYFTGIVYPFQTAHNLYIDENGIAYIFGADYGVGGAIMLDLNQDPMAPVELGVYDDYYLHDGMVRGDTLYGSHISDGFQSIIDVSNKSNPTMQTNWNTPNNFSHNCWVSDDGNYLFTTDEKEFAYIGAYDISDFNNVTETDRWQSNPGSGVIPHNTHFLDNYVITSYYADGLSVVDVSNPTNLVEVGNYDTSPNFAGNDQDGFHGAWGAYPWLPSGNILITDIEEGLVVIGPTYVRACWLEGNITDSICGDNLNNVVVEIMSTSYTESSDISGSYAFGTPTSGTYIVQFSKPGYQTKTISGVTLTNGLITNIDVQLYSGNTVAITGTVSSGGGALEDASVQLTSSTDQYNFNTNSNGEFDKCNIVTGTYDVIVSKWGYKTYCASGVSITTSGNLAYVLENGYYDDFTLDLDWSVTSVSSSGKWDRGNPIGTVDGNGNPASPEDDATNTDCGNTAYITGNGGGSFFDDDIDNGSTTLTSPTFSLTSYNDPYISFYTWFVNNGGNTAPNDYLSVSITNGTSTVELLSVDTSDTMYEWVYHNFRLNDFIAKGSNMNLIVEASDDDPGNIVEAGFDVFQIVDSAATSIDQQVISSHEQLIVFPNPFIKPIQIELGGNSSIDKIVITDVLGKEVKSIVAANRSIISLNLDVTPGVYYLNAYVDETLVKSQKVVKQ